jgi:hypothetical protein
MTESSIETALELSLLSSSYGFFVGFNSLCALASVNHLHFHAYYLDYILPIQKLVCCLLGRLLLYCQKNKIILFRREVEKGQNYGYLMSIFYQHLFYNCMILIIILKVWQS